MKIYIKSSSDMVERENTLSFDFRYKFEYDRDIIFDSINKVLTMYDGYIIYLDFESVDYSMESEFSDYAVSQCNVTFACTKNLDEHSFIEDIHDALLDGGYTIIGESLYTPDTAEPEVETIHTIVKQRGWYDPEGLDTTHPDDVVFTGTLLQCEKWLSNEYAEATKSDYASIERYIPGECLQIYYPNAISRTTYMIM